MDDTSKVRWDGHFHWWLWAILVILGVVHAVIMVPLYVKLLTWWP